MLWLPAAMFSIVTFTLPFTKVTICSLPSTKTVKLPVTLPREMETTGLSPAMIFSGTVMFKSFLILATLNEAESNAG